MGKGEDEYGLPSTTLDAQGTTSGSRRSNGCCLGCSRVRKLVTFRCVVVLVLGVGVLLSAVFWLPFFHFGHHKDLDLDYAGHDIVASFMLKKPTSFLQDYILQLEGDIFEEMSFSTTKVHILSLEPAGSNITKIVFAVEADVTTQSLIKGSFVSLITSQTVLQLTESLFGNPFSFEVLKFRGGITVSPEQKAFLFQSDQILFNFTLNFSIDEMLSNFDQLRSQLKTGLHLGQYENLYIRLTNLRGSTVLQPTTIQSQVVLAVGIDPSKRLKQLAQTITHSHTKNLGLNNTVFGRVKQVRLSDILQHSLGSGPPSPSPSPSPMPPESHHHHHHHRHHHHDATLTPSIFPSISPSPERRAHGPASRRKAHKATLGPAPAPGRNIAAEPPACHFGYNFPKYSQLPPYAAPVHAPYGAPSQPKQIDYSTPAPSPVPAVTSPLPNVAYGHSQPPLGGGYHATPVEVLPIVSPSPSPSSAGIFSSSNIWALLPFLLFVLHL